MQIRLELGRAVAIKWDGMNNVPRDESDGNDEHNAGNSADDKASPIRLTDVDALVAEKTTRWLRNRWAVLTQPFDRPSGIKVAKHLLVPKLS